MPDYGRRDVVQDPLASAPTGAARELGLSGVSNPNQSGGQVSDGKLVQALGGVQQVLAQALDKEIDTEVTRGKIAFMSGVTNASLIENGNKYTARGYEALNAVDKANTWYQSELADIEVNGAQMDPTEYQKQIMEKRKALLADLPTDPEVQKVFVSAFEDLGPKLSAVQMQANSAYNKGQQTEALSRSLMSTADTSSSPRVMPGGSLAVSPSVVSEPVQSDQSDRDAGIRTMLGEAGNQGEVGLAAVAWNLKNRLATGKWGNSIFSVVHSPKQYSAWNEIGQGGNDYVRKYGPGTPQYERAGKVYDAVMGGHVVDMTAGALNYFSKSGMKAAGDLDGLPAWYTEQVAAGKVEIQIGGHTFMGNRKTWKPGAKTYGTTVQKFLDAASMLKPEEKATALAGAIALQLDGGNDTLWNATGGLSTLSALGASTAELAQVQNARQRYEATKANEFNIADEQWKQDTLTDLETGKTQLSDVMQAIQDRYDSKNLDDAGAKALVSQAYAAVGRKANADAALDAKAAAAAEKHNAANPAWLNEIAGLYQNFRTDPSMTFEEATNQVAAIASKYGESQAETDQIIGKMHEIDNARRTDIINAANGTAAMKIQQDGLKSSIKQAVAQGSGLQDVKGDVRVPNPDGTMSTVPAKQWGISYLRDQIASGLSWKVANGSMKPAEAAAKLDGELYSQLSKQGVPDTQFGQAVTAAVTGVIVGKDGVPTQSALAAYDWYKRMVDNPDVGGAYVSSMVTDPYTRTLLETARALDSGRGDPSEAVAKAYEFMSNKNIDQNYRVSQDKDFDNLLHTGVTNYLTNATSGGFYGWLDSKWNIYSPEERAALVKPANMAAAMLYVQKQAQINYIRFPQAVPQAHLQQAIQDFEQNARIVGSSIIIGENGRTIQDDMGLTGMPQDAPTKALDKWLVENMPKVSQEYGWGDQYTALRASLVDIGIGGKVGVEKDIFGKDIPGTGVFIGGRLAFGNATNPDIPPPYTVNYNAQQGTMTISFWSDSTRTNIIGKPVVLHAEQLGKEYLDSTREVSPFASIVNGAVNLAAQGQQVRNADVAGQELGSKIGSMAGKY